MNAISTAGVPHTVRVPPELRALVAAMVDRGELAPGEVVGTLRLAMRCGLAAAVDAEASPPPPRTVRPPRPQVDAAAALARLERLEGVARAVDAARALLAAGARQRSVVARLNGSGLLNVRGSRPRPWNVWSLARALSLSSESSEP